MKWRQSLKLKFLSWKNLLIFYDLRLFCYPATFLPHNETWFAYLHTSRSLLWRQIGIAIHIWFIAFLVRKRTTFIDKVVVVVKIFHLWWVVVIAYSLVEESFLTHPCFSTELFIVTLPFIDNSFLLVPLRVEAFIPQSFSFFLNSVVLGNQVDILIQTLHAQHNFIVFWDRL